MFQKGISIIICCYNSSWIIERCLEALINQKVSHNLLWEIIVVNNASTDNTIEIASKILSQNNIDYSLVDENNPGLLSARKCGVNKAKYSYIIFCDDDNILCDTYISKMFEIMESDNSIGAYGGRGIAEFEIEPDPIIHKHIASYAIGSQKGYHNRLYGAGICVKKECVEKIYEKNNFVLTGRCGNSLLAGDDSELVKTIIIQGYKIGATDELTFRHVLSSKRLNKKYLHEMQKGFGLSAPVLYIYDLRINQKPFISFYEYYISCLIKFIAYSLLYPYKHSYSINITYLLYVIKGTNFWGIKRLKNIYNNLSNNNTQP